MKKSLLALALLPSLGFAQITDSTIIWQHDLPNTYTSGSTQVKKFDNQSRFFKDWSVSIGGGPAFMAFADLTSFYGEKVNWGYNAYISLDKQITHTFGMSLMFANGKTNQKAALPWNPAAGVGVAYTKYNQLSILGDVNFSNLFRRVDNLSRFRWALHGYAGVGFQGYKTLLLDNDVSRWSTAPARIPTQVEQDLGIASFFYTGGVGLKYNAGKLIDVELRAMYVKSGDEEFDGGGWTRNQAPRVDYNLINDSYSDDMFSINLGLTFKLGKHDTHLAWYDPLNNAYARLNELDNAVTEVVVCSKGDLDNDGVCDDWDRELNTPAGARVDGSGTALDMDLDGVIDLNDKCVTVPGSAANNGCPQ